MEVADGALELQRGQMWSEALTLGLALADHSRKAQRQRSLSGKARASMIHLLLCSMPSYAARHQSVGRPVTDKGQVYNGTSVRTVGHFGVSVDRTVAQRAAPFTI
jgi:hypothetical protein